jgi:hypothetical protein
MVRRLSRMPHRRTCLACASAAHRRGHHRPGARPRVACADYCPRTCTSGRWRIRSSTECRRRGSDGPGHYEARAADSPTMTNRRQHRYQTTHYAHGDCETCGTAIEMNCTLHVRFGLHKREAAQKGIRYPRFCRTDHYLSLEYCAPRRFCAATGTRFACDAQRPAQHDRPPGRAWLDSTAGLHHLQRRR